MKHLMITTAAIISLAAAANAEGDDLTPAAMQEVVMAEQLMALGKARGEPLMVLAAIRLRATLGGPSGAPLAGLTSQEEAIAIARDLAAGDDALLGIVGDVEVNSSRRMCIYARNGVCY